MSKMSSLGQYWKSLVSQKHDLTEADKENLRELIKTNMNFGLHSCTLFKKQWTVDSLKKFAKEEEIKIEFGENENISAVFKW
jgi:hypothetical protein